MIKMEKKEFTTIQLKKLTVGRLKAFRIVKKESYDELLNRLMNKILGEKK